VIVPRPGAVTPRPARTPAETPGGPARVGLLGPQCSAGALRRGSSELINKRYLFCYCSGTSSGSSGSSGSSSSSAVAALAYDREARQCVKGQAAELCQGLREHRSSGGDSGSHALGLKKRRMHHQSVENSITVGRCVPLGPRIFPAQRYRVDQPRG
jgi:hypothetical protein